MSTSVAQVVLPWLIALNGGARDLAVFASAVALMTFIAMPALSPLGDRLPKQQLVMFGLLLYTIESLVIALLATIDHYNIALLVVLEMGGVACYSLVAPIMSNAPADLLEPNTLTHAVSLQKGIQSLGRLVGPVVAGAVIATFGSKAALWLHAILPLVAIAFTRNIGLSRSASSTATTRPLHRWKTDLMRGAKAVWTVHIERYWSLINFVSWLFAAPAVGMLVPLKVHALGLSGAWLASCEAGLAVGILAGSFYLSAKIIACCGRYAARIASGLALGLSLAVAGLAQSPWLLLIAFVACGLANATLLLVGLTHRMLARPKAFRTRMSGATMTLNQIAAAAGPALAGLALTHWSVNEVYAAFGVLTAIASSLIILIKGFKHFVNLDHESVDGWYGRQYPDVFSEENEPTQSKVATPA